MRVAVLGTGLMGAGMARSLVRAGHDVSAWNRTRSKAEPLAADGVSVSDSVAAAVTGSDAVLTMLFDEPSTVAVAAELASASGPDCVWIQAATVGPEGIRRIADAARIAVLDAPVLGTRKPAEDGKLVVLVAGPDDVVARVSPVFDAIGGRTIRVGSGVGAASALKLACNAYIAMVTAATAQSLALAESLGVDPHMFLDAIGGGPLDSAYAQVKGAAMLAGDFTASFALDGVLKDLGLMLDSAREADFPPGLLSAVRGVFERASGAGHGSDDMAAVRSAFPPY